MLGLLREGKMMRNVDPIVGKMADSVVVLIFRVLSSINGKRLEVPCLLVPPTSGVEARG